MPVCVDVAPGSWRDLIARVSGANTTSLAHRHYPLVRVQQDAAITLNEITFSYTHYHVYRELAPAGRGLTVLGSSGFEQTNFDVHVEATRGLDDTLRLALIYDTALFYYAFMTRLVTYYARAVEQLVADVDAPSHPHAAGRCGTRRGEGLERHGEAVRRRVRARPD